MFSSKGRTGKREARDFVAALAVLFLLGSQTTTSAARITGRQQAVSTDQAEVRKLEVGRPVEREMKGGESHTYEIELQAGQYFKAVVEQRGVDVAVQVIGPDGKQLMEVDQPIGAQGPEPVEVVAEATGNYRIRVRSLKKEAGAGKYEVRVDEIRAATDNDRALQEATKLNQEVGRLYGVGKYDAALPLAERALAIREKALGPEHPDTGISLSNLAGLYYLKGDYARAEPLFIRDLAIHEKALGAEHPETATSLNNLAGLYQVKGDYARAEPLHIRALAIFEKVLGAKHPHTAVSLNNLAMFYQAKGDYAKAEPLHIRALAIREKALGPEHPSTVTSLNNLAQLYKAKGDYAKAEPNFIRALEISEKALGAEHPDTARSLNNLAELYRAEGDYAKAEPLHIRALAICERVLGAKHPHTAVPLDNLALLYQAKGDYEKAEPLHIRALAIREKALGPEHPDTASSLHNLAGLYRSKGDYAKAEPLFVRSLAIHEKALGPEHPDTARLLNTLAGLYRAKGDYARAVDFQSRCNDASDRDLIRNLASGSESQKLTYLARTSLYTDSTISLHAQSLPNDVNAKRAAVKVLLQRKGRALDAMADAIAALHRRLSPEDQKLLDQLQDVRSQLSVLTLRGPGREGLEKHRANLKELEEQEEQLQNLLSQRSAEFRAQSQAQSKPVTIEEIQRAIPQDTALIEFTQYRPYDPKETVKEKRLGKPRYVAYVLASRGESQWVELGDAESINQKIEALRKALRDPRRKEVKRLARAVDQKIMEPVRPLLGDVRQLLISPDGALNLIPFEALVDEQDRYLVEHFACTYLTSGRDLLRMQVARESRSKPTVVANPLFGEPATEHVVRAAARPAVPKSRRRSVTSASDMSEVYFAPLTGTAQEARSIRRLFPEASLLTGAQATESALKQVAAPRVLHIATHGFFLQDAGTASADDTLAATRGINANAKVENPLLRSGLALAGANLRKAGTDDGLLTALEASGLNLWGTKLVTLSACDTGLGEVKNGEGIYGLRRAFVLAGTETVVMSLWPVSDYMTREMMSNYYRGLKQGQGRGAALRQAQLGMLKRKDRQHPFYWASFIQSGEWANLDGKR